MKWFYITMIAAALSGVAVYFFFPPTKIEIPSPATPLVDKAQDNSKHYVDVPESKIAASDQVPSPPAIISCPAPLALTDAKVKQIEDSLRQMLDTPGGARAKDALIFAVHMPAKEKIKRIFSLIEKGDYDPALLSHAARLCALHSSQRICRALIKRSAIVNADDAENWLSVALFYAAENDEPNLVYALNEMLNAPQFTSAYADYLKRALHVIPDEGFTRYTALIHGVGTWAASAVPFPALRSWCNAQNQYSLNNDLCRRAGQTLFVRSKENISRIFGLQLSLSTFNEAEDSDSIAQVSAQLLQLTTWPKKRRSDFERSINLVAYDETLIPIWLDALEFEGEASASEELIREASIRSKNDAYKPCPRAQQ
ncbi:hypothetical protein HHX48_00800 [Salinimonas sp. HHU 13199]|uniref:HEAT repeat domain-containing protein n=1 Tax=Salinimonas profundi TaxID=2729140 RepID=A0ABR8LJI8_9ALTE|nr:hypothetical protein [Salinimonas profundi]MBD3584270.1 hypothetical protein [Salinimonas profundi]